MIYGIGETVLDILFKERKPLGAIPGGSTFNSIISLAKAGNSCAMLTEVGDDKVADLICDYLQCYGVDTRFVFRHRGTQSHLSLAFLNEQNDADYQFYKDHSSISLDITLPQLNKSDCVLFGSFFAINPQIRERVVAFLRQAHDAGAFLYYDINFRKSHIADLPQVADNIRQNITLSSIVRGSLEDFVYLYSAHTAEEVYEKHIKDLCPYFICTDGAKDIQLFTPLFCASYPVEQIPTISTVGAGDSFNAGLLHALEHLTTNAYPTLSSLSHDDWSALIRMGQRFSCDVCQHLENSISPEFVKELEKD